MLSAYKTNLTSIMRIILPDPCWLLVKLLQELLSLQQLPLQLIPLFLLPQPLQQSLLQLPDKHNTMIRYTVI